MTPDDPRAETSFADILTASPEDIQTWLDARLEASSEDVKAVIEAVDYVEPGSIRQPGFDYYLMLGMYDGERETVEIAFQVKPGMDAPFALFLKLL